MNKVTAIQSSTGVQLEVTFGTKSDSIDFINQAHKDKYVFMLLGFTSVISVKDAKVKKLKQNVEHDIGYVHAHPLVTYKRLSLNKFQVTVDITACPNIGAANHKEDALTVGLQCSKDYWNYVFETNKTKMLTFEPQYEIDSDESISKPGNGTHSKMTDEWRQAIGDGHRGQKYKTKKLEGITWNWGTIGKRKVKQLIAKF